MPALRMAADCCFPRPPLPAASPRRDAPYRKASSARGVDRLTLLRRLFDDDVATFQELRPFDELEHQRPRGHIEAKVALLQPGFGDLQPRTDR
jgi:hypothetical protein